MNPVRRTASLALSILALGVTGCSLTTTATSVMSPIAVPGVAIAGIAHGGQQPVVGAKVYLLEADTTAYGHASKSLLTSATGNSADSIGYYVLTGSYGQFSITGDYTCDAGAQVYLYALGGNSGSGVNSGIGMMSVIGQCPSSAPFTFLNSVPYVYVDEVSTVAAAYAIAGFATDATHVSAPSGDTINHPMAAAGIANAFANAANLASVATGQAYTVTPGGNGTVPQSRLNTLANILAACVNSTNFTSTPCNTLSANAKSGGSTGTTPTDTATAAINIAHNPSANVTALFDNQTAMAPFMPDLTTAPSDFTITILFTGGGLAAANSLSYEPHSIAVDAQGNVWAAGGQHTSVLTKFTPLGLASSHASKSDYATGIAIDAGSSNIWIANYGFQSASYVKYNIASGTATQYASQLSSNDTPVDVALDGSGNVWIADNIDGNSNSGNGAVLEINASSGAIVQDLYSNTTGYPYAPYGIAIQPGTTGNVWVTDDADNGGTSAVSVYSDAGASVANYTSGAVFHPLSDAIDSSGNVWVGNSNSGAADGSLTKLTTSGSGTNYTLGNSAFYIPSVAVDGASNIWMSGYSSGAFYEITDGGIKLSPTAGFVATNASGISTTTVQSVAIDGSGDVWYNANGDAAMREVIGAATPVATPIAYAVANGLLGQRP